MVTDDRIATGICDRQKILALVGCLCIRGNLTLIFHEDDFPLFLFFSVTPSAGYPRLTIVAVIDETSCRERKILLRMINRVVLQQSIKTTETASRYSFHDHLFLLSGEKISLHFALGQSFNVVMVGADSARNPGTAEAGANMRMK